MKGLRKPFGVTGYSNSQVWDKFRNMKMCKIFFPQKSSKHCTHINNDFFQIGEPMSLLGSLTGVCVRVSPPQWVMTLGRLISDAPCPDCRQRHWRDSFMVIAMFSLHKVLFHKDIVNQYVTSFEHVRQSCFDRHALCTHMILYIYLKSRTHK